MTQQEVTQPFEYFDYQNAKGYLKMLYDDFLEERQATIKRRDIRFIDVSVEQLRKDGTILKDETFLPQRVADTNIRREMAQYLSYLRQGRRLVIFTPVDGKRTIAKVEKLEEEFTRGMRYNGWDIVLEKTIDSTATHGWGWTEVVFDPTKPLSVGLEYHPHERVVFYWKSEDFESNECVMITQEFSPMKLSRCVSQFGFNKSVVDKLLEKQKDPKSPNKNTLLQINKVFMKFEGVVYIGWMSLDGEDWLKPMEQLDLGKRKAIKTMKQVPITDMLGEPQFDELGNPLMTEEETVELVPVPIKSYPLFMEVYQETERPLIKDHKGRVFFDQYKQEAQTSVWSSFINGCNRAAGLYGSADSGDPSGPPKQTKLVLKHGFVIDKKVTFYAPPYPDPVMLSAVNQAEVSNANEVGQTTFAVMQKGAGSRTTAKEVSAAERDGALLSSANLLQLSRHLGAVYTFVWDLVQNYALQGKIPLLQDENGKNDIETIGRNYVVQPAGDVDYIKREELKQLYLMLWNFVQNSPLRDVFLARMLRLFLPEDGDQFATLLEQGSPSQIVKALMALIEPLVANDLAAMTPEQKMQLQTILSQAQAYVVATDSVVQSSGNTGPNNEAPTNEGAVTD